MNKHTTVEIDFGDRSYPIHIGDGVLSNAANLLSADIHTRESFIISDVNAKDYAFTLESSLKDSGAVNVNNYVLDGGEKTKSWPVYEKLCEWLLENGLKRDAVIYAVGGGVIGDLVGFAAATVMRGVDFVQVPTTLLAQVDSSVGGKTGINTANGKNLVGSFYQPRAVLIDTKTLKTLPSRQIRAGYAEIVKYGLINDLDFFGWLKINGADVCAQQDDALIYAIQKSVKSKAGIVQADEKESGQRALLNLGHTYAHALEAAAGYDGTLLHGEAVAIGIILALETSVRMGLLPHDALSETEAHFKAIGMMTRVHQISPKLQVTTDDLLATMRKDKKADRKSIKFILARAIGESFVCSNVDMGIVQSVIKDSLES